MQGNPTDTNINDMTGRSLLHLNPWPWPANEKHSAGDLRHFIGPLTQLSQILVRCVTGDETKSTSMFIVNQVDHQMDKSHGCEIRAKQVKYFHTVLDTDATALSIRQHELGMIHLALSDAFLDGSRCINAARITLASLSVLCITDTARTEGTGALRSQRGSGRKSKLWHGRASDVPKIKKIARFWRHSHRATCQGADCKTHLVCT